MVVMTDKIKSCTENYCGTNDVRTWFSRKLQWENLCWRSYTQWKTLFIKILLNLLGKNNWFFCLKNFAKWNIFSVAKFLWKKNIYSKKSLKRNFAYQIFEKKILQWFFWIWQDFHMTLTSHHRDLLSLGMNKHARWSAAREIWYTICNHIFLSVGG